MKRAVIYARFSPRRNAATSLTIESQIKMCSSYCELHGYRIEDTHVDEELSGKTMEGRVGLESALKTCCRLGNESVLVVYSLSRMARSTIDAINIANRLSNSGADLASVKESIDTSTGMGRFIFTVFAALDELERERISERTKDVMRSASMSGRRMTRKDRVPYGYKAKGNQHIVPDASEQNTIKKIIEWHKEGKGPQRISTLLNKSGLKPRGQKWYSTTVTSIVERNA